MKYIAISPGPYTGSGYYGLGETVDEAKANCKAQGGRLTHYVVKQLPDGATDVGVDSIGQITWKWEPGYDAEPRIIHLPIVATRGLGLKVDA